jgi:UDP-N-acetylmuramoyl-tripeptide--D-alanyl-D-alanine ligase
MRALWEALPSERRGGYAESSTALESAVIGEIQAGDAIMVKGSLGSKMATIVAALTRKFSSQQSVAAAAQG